MGKDMEGSESCLTIYCPRICFEAGKLREISVRIAGDPNRDSNPTPQAVNLTIHLKSNTEIKNDGPIPPLPHTSSCFCT
jgi:hypothetical protein